MTADATPLPTAEAAVVTAESAPAQEAAAKPVAAIGGRCAWLAAEALRLEARAAELDRRGNASAEALFHHRRAAAKLVEAATLCPEGHPDAAMLRDHAQDVATRAIYLESLGGAPAELPLEDHVGEPPMLVGLDLSAAEAVVPPPEEEVAALVARSGISGASATLTEEGFSLVAALRSDVEMRVYALRLLDAAWMRPKGGEEAEAAQLGLSSLAVRFSGEGDARGLRELRDELRRAPWAELKLDPQQDRLQVAVALEKEARELEADGRGPEALVIYERSLAVLQLVFKFDARMKNPRIKEMVRKRMEELLDRAEHLKVSVAATG